MYMFVRGLKDYLVSELLSLIFINTDLIKYYLGRGLATRYGTYNFVKYFKGSGLPRACILNTNIRKKRR